MLKCFKCKNLDEESIEGFCIVLQQYIVKISECEDFSESRKI